jgi:glycine hydroxymethyltransferase
VGTDRIEATWGPDFAGLATNDSDVARLLLLELERERTTLQLVASENFTSPAVLAAQGSVLTNKYADGLPGERDYPGCGPVDEIERLCIARAKALFGADHANVQPYSGTSANRAAYAAFLKPGDRVLAMSTAAGGHPSHEGSLGGAAFETTYYGVAPSTECIDYDEVSMLARRLRPKLIVCGGSALPRCIEFAVFRAIADQVGAKLMVDAAHFAGLVAGHAIPSPVPLADVVTLTTHKVLRGPRGGAILCKREHAAVVDYAVVRTTQGGPLMHTVAAKAVAFGECQKPAFRTYAAVVVENSKALASALANYDGLRVVTGGTDTHLVLVELRANGLCGQEAQRRCELAGIALNDYPVPRPTTEASAREGIRVGPPAITTQGMRASAMPKVAEFVIRALGLHARPTDPDRLRAELCAWLRPLDPYPSRTA